MIARLKSAHLGIAYEMPKDSKRVWSTPMFHGYRINDVVAFFNELVKEGIIYRDRAQRGPKSGARLVSAKKFLDLCVKGFTDNKMARFMYVSKSPHAEIISNLPLLHTKYYIGGFLGVKDSLKEVSDNTLTILIPDRSWFTGYIQNELQMKLGISKVQSNGDIEIIFPRYHGFLEKYHQEEGGLPIASDYYTYLAMKSSQDPMAQQQAKYMETALRGKHGSFLCGR
jgi:hypothetical protein